MSVRDKYFLNESEILKAWMFNKETSKILTDPQYQVKAHLVSSAIPDISGIYLDFHQDLESGQHYLEMPAEIFPLLKSGKKPLSLQLEVIAQRLKPDSATVDPWFVRRLPPVIIELVEPFIQWALHQNQFLRCRL